MSDKCIEQYANICKDINNREKLTEGNDEDKKRATLLIKDLNDSDKLLKSITNIIKDGDFSIAKTMIGKLTSTLENIKKRL